MPERMLVPLIVASALFMQNLDSTVVATALPAIAQDFGANPIHLKLALTTYLLTIAVFLPASGWMADRFGARMVFRAAIAIFIAGSALCGLSRSIEMLVFARIVQGIGGSMMVPVGRLVVLRTVQKSELVTALSWLTVPALVGPILGPPVGGFLTTYASWPWIFWINVPVGFLGIALATRYVPDLHGEGKVRFDTTGFALVGLGLAAFMTGSTTLGLNLLPLAADAVLHRRRGGAARRLCGACPAQRPSDPQPVAVPHPDLLAQRHRRLDLPPGHRRDALPAAPAAPARLRHDAVPVGLDHLRHRRRRRGHEIHARRRSSGATASATCWWSTPCSAPPSPRCRRSSCRRRR